MGHEGEEQGRVDGARGRRAEAHLAQASLQPLATRAGAPLLALGAYDEPIAVGLAGSRIAR